MSNTIKRRVERKKTELLGIENYINQFIGDDRLCSTSWNSVKRQMEDYQIVTAKLFLAYDQVSADAGALVDAVADESYILDEEKLENRIEEIKADIECLRNQISDLHTQIAELPFAPLSFTVAARLNAIGSSWCTNEVFRAMHRGTIVAHEAIIRSLEECQSYYEDKISDLFGTENPLHRFLSKR